MSENTNSLSIFSDQHSREVLGCYGNKHVHTPNLDKLAKNGTIFKNSYCNYPSVLDCVGAQFKDEDRELPGESLWPLARGETSPQRMVFSEDHAVGINAASYMIRKGDYKLNYYVGYPSQLFDLKNDPSELVDLVEHPDYLDIRKDLEAELRKIMGPEETDTKAREAQRIMVEKHGGEEMFVGKPKKFEYSPVPEELK